MDKKIGFDSELYLKNQTEKILERIDECGGKRLRNRCSSTDFEEGLEYEYCDDSGGWSRDWVLCLSVCCKRQETADSRTDPQEYRRQEVLRRVRRHCRAAWC